MIKILISGPQGISKTAIAKMIYKAMHAAGFIKVKIYTTNVEMDIDDSIEIHLEDA